MEKIVKAGVSGDVLVSKMLAEETLELGKNQAFFGDRTFFVEKALREIEEPNDRQVRENLDQVLRSPGVRKALITLTF